jgi:hypothetical protein
MTLYMAIAVIFEERDLVNHFGQLYHAYQKRVPMVIPRFGQSDEMPAPIPVESMTRGTANVKHVVNDDMFTRSHR